MIKTAVRVLMIGVAVAACAAAGCGPLKLPDPPLPIETPTAQVLRVREVDAGVEAVRYQITVRLENPNEFALPLTYVVYTLRIGQASYGGDLIPNATIPAEGDVIVEIPAVLDASARDPTYRTTGTFQMRPPGEIRALLHDLGVPLPTTAFDGSGTIEHGGASAASAASP